MTERRFWVAVLLATLLGGALRILALELAQPTRLMGDETYYAEVAVNLAHSGEHRFRQTEALRPPAHAWVLSNFAKLKSNAEGSLDLQGSVEASIYGMQRSQVFLGVPLIPLSCALGLLLFGRKVGAIAGALVAVDPILIGHSHLLWSETFVALLLTLVLVLAALYRRKPAFLTAIAVGLALGAAALAREMTLLTAPVIVIWWCWPELARVRSRTTLHSVVMAVVVLLVLAPWVTRNTSKFGRVLPLSTIGWFAIAEGNTFEDGLLQIRGPQRHRFREQYYGESSDEMERLDFARRHALEGIRRAQPGWIFKKSIQTAYWMWGPGAYSLEKIRRGSYGPLRLEAVRAILVLTVGCYLVQITAALLGLAATREADRLFLPLAILTLVIGVHIFANAAPRFRVPWMPLLTVYAAHAFVLGRGVLNGIPRWRLAVVSLLVLCLLWTTIPFVGDTARPLWELGSAAGGGRLGP